MSEHDDLDPQLHALASWLDASAEPLTLGEVRARQVAAGGSAAGAGAGGLVPPGIPGGDRRDAVDGEPSSGERISPTTLDPTDADMTPPLHLDPITDDRRFASARDRRLLALAAIVAVIALIAGALALTGGGDDSTDFATDVTTTPGVADLTHGWQRVEDALPGGSFWAVGSNGDKLIAATYGDGACTFSNPPQCSPVILEAWISPDGAEWTRSGTIAALAEVPTTSRTTIEWIGDRWVLAGSVAGAPVVWTSTDGASWETAPVDSGDTPATVTGLTPVGGGTITVGNTDEGLAVDGVPPVNTFQSPLVWRSSDPSGRMWDASTTTMESLPVSAGPNGDHAYGILASGATVIAYGVAVPFDLEATTVPDSVRPAANNAHPVMWVSLDSGATWIQTILDDGMGRIMSGAEFGDRFLLSGTLDGRSAMWTVDSSGIVTSLTSSVLVDPPSTATDPATEVPVGRDAAIPWSLAASPSGLVAIDHAGHRLMVGIDGTDWQPVEQAGLVATDAVISHITAHRNGFVAFGDFHDSPTVWVWQPSGSVPPTTADTTAATNPPDPTSTTAPPTSAAPPTTGGAEYDGQVCIESIVSTLQDAYLEGDGSDTARDAVTVLVDLGTFERWEREDVCVTTIVLSQDGLELTAMDETLSADLEASTLSLVPDGSLIIYRYAVVVD